MTFGDFLSEQFGYALLVAFYVVFVATMWAVVSAPKRKQAPEETKRRAVVSDAPFPNARQPIAPTAVLKIQGRTGK